jgi:hypothetical protein
MAHHYFQMIGQFLTDNIICDTSCYFQEVEKLGYWEKDSYIMKKPYVGIMS